MKLRAGALAAVLLVSAGCIDKPKSTASPLRRVATAFEEVADLMASVQDAKSARAAAPKFDPTYSELIDAFNALVAQGAGQSSGMAGLAGGIAAMKDLERSQLRVAKEGKRIESLEGLPVEFWDEARVHTYRLLAALASSGAGGGDPTGGAIQQISALYQELGPRKIVEVTLQNAPYDPAHPAIAKLRELAGPNARTVDFANPEVFSETLVAVGPVADFDAFVQGVDFGEVIEQEEARGEVTVLLPDPTPEEVANQSGGEGAYGGEAPIDPAAAEAERIAREQAEAEAEEARKLAAEQARIEALLGNPAKATAEGHAELVALAANRESEHHDRAVAALGKLDAKLVSDKKLRGSIARMYRTLALESETHRAAAIDGLVAWGGKYSVPVLVELLAGGQSNDREPIYEALAAVPTPEGAAAVFDQLQTDSDNEQAVECLRRMGVAAEQAILAKLPAENAEQNVTGLTLLGDVGTAECYAVLRKATKSETAEVKAAAVEAFRRIRERERRE